MLQNIYVSSDVKITINKIYSREYPHSVSLSARDGHFFSNRVVNTWNSLPDSVISRPSVAMQFQTEITNA